MSLINEIYSEVETLRGMLTALKVNYPDLTPRVEPAIAKVDAVLNNPSDRTIHYFIEDMLELDNYFRDILGMLDKSDKYLIGSVMKTMELMNILMGSEERTRLH